MSLWIQRIGAAWTWICDRSGPWPLASYEAFGMRLFFSLLVYIETFPPLKERFAEQPKPNGIAQWFDLTFFADPQTYSVLAGLGVVALALYVLGLLPVLALPYLAWFSIASKTLANSQGGISHSYQMVSLILLAQALVALWWFACGLRGERGWRGLPGWLATGLRAERFAHCYSVIVIAACYVVAGVTKLVNSDGKWLWNTPYLVKDLVKTDRQNYYSQPGTETLDTVFPYADAMLAHPMLARIVFSPGVLLELAAVLALLGRRWALAIGLACIGLHLGIGEVMDLHFKVFILTVLIFLVNVPYWVGRCFGRR